MNEQITHDVISPFVNRPHENDTQPSCMNTL